MNYIVHADTLEEIASELGSYITHVEGDLDSIRDQLEDALKYDVEDFESVQDEIGHVINQIDDLRKSISK